MADLQYSAASDSNNGVRRESRWSEEYDRLPLKQRMKLLFAQNRLAQLLPEVNSGFGENSISSTITNCVAVGKEDNESESLCPASFAGEEKIGNVSSQKSYTGERKDQVIEAHQMKNATVAEEKANVMGTGSFRQPLLSKNAVSMKLKCSDKSPSGLSGNCSNSSSGVDLAAAKVKTECPLDVFDGLDLVPLKERRRALLSSQKMGLISSSAEGSSMQLSRSVDNMTQKNPKVVKEKNQFLSKEFLVARNQLAENQKNLNSLLKLPRQDGPCSSPLAHLSQQNRSTSVGKMTIIKEKNAASSFKKKCSGSEANNGKSPLFSNTAMLNPAIKIEPEENKKIVDKIPAASLPSNDMFPVKYEPDIADDSYTDKLDHILLSERPKLWEKVKVPNLEIKGTVSSSKVAPSGLNSQPIVPEAVKGLGSDRPRKRRKTATDAVETALEEDAPGLLRVLIEKGVSMDEIKLYGQMESDEALEDLPNDDNFTELESVISKACGRCRDISVLGITDRFLPLGEKCGQIFSQRTSLLKLAPLQSKRGERPSYCLACLLSLVEQAHYLRFRKWPVEWGWTRDLQSFIFVFKRHNRIVLERPEYGYATYFFELVDSLSIDWQIKRLVIAMKLTSYSRVTLIENKALEVGQDLTEGEAKVLMEYGWIPNTGLGTMLNYCDRVVHDRKNEKDTSEWRSKIGKLLVDGYNGGSIVSTDLPIKAVQHSFAQRPEIKLEVE